MANLSEDIQCAGSDTRPPMLDRTDFASWQQRIRLYCRGKENGVNILKSIDEGPFQMGTFRETLSEGNEGALHLGPERPRVYSDLSPKDKDRYNADIQATNILLQGLPKDIYSLINHYTGETIHDYYVRFAKIINDMRNIKMTMSIMQLNSKFVNNMLPERGRFVTAVKLNRGLRESNYDQLSSKAGQVLQLQRYKPHSKELHLAQATTELRILYRQDVTDDLALNVDNLFQANDYDAFDSDVDEAPTAQTMFMDNLSSADPVYDKADSSYDTDILSEVHDHDHYQDAVYEHHEEHEMHDDVQPNYVVDSHADYTSNSNMITYDQYVKDNAMPVVQSNVSSVTNDAYKKLYNYLSEPRIAESVSKKTTRTIVVDNSLTVNLKLIRNN
ncbi:hypothetical protein Tco_1210128 [Tanacetum coccineum]